MIKNRDETMILIIIPTPLIYGEGLRHDCNPSEALLRLYSHPRNGYSHRAGTYHSHRRNTQPNGRSLPKNARQSKSYRRISPWFGSPRARRIRNGNSCCVWRLSPYSWMGSANLDRLRYRFDGARERRRAPASSVPHRVKGL